MFYYYFFSSKHYFHGKLNSWPPKAMHQKLSKSIKARLTKRYWTCTNVASQSTEGHLESKRRMGYEKFKKKKAKQTFRGPGNQCRVLLSASRMSRSRKLHHKCEQCNSLKIWFIASTEHSLGPDISHIILNKSSVSKSFANNIPQLNFTRKPMLHQLGENLQQGEHRRKHFYTYHICSYKTS